MAEKRKSGATAGEEPGDKVLRARVTERTRSQYNTMNVHLKKWLQSSVPGAVVGDVIQLPLKTSTCKSFLASVTVKRKRGDASGKTNIPNSYSTVNGYINAIKFLHKEGKVEIPKDLDDMLKAFANGYKRQVAKFKANGTMSMQEGKIPLTTEGAALVIKIGRTKNDQEGKMAWPRHVYANPFEPTICPILRTPCVYSGCSSGGDVGTCFRREC
ncbi:hypothetical protein Ae201684P_021353 [Aphanomyces euteiches]|nr:hypothetical protein Ae201684P_021353 [Aphanomyces euteiches]